MSTFDDFMIGQAVEKDSEIHKLIEEKRALARELAEIGVFFDHDGEPYNKNADELAAKAGVLKDALALLAMSAEYALRVGYKSEDCGDHCSNGCYWCDLRRETAAARTILDAK
jgi:hypothetical protein